MKKTMVKPEIVEMDVKLEGVYASSGAAPVRCRFGRRECNSGSDTCQVCSKTDGAYASGFAAFKDNFNGCPDCMPMK